jgi:7,8-dihydropterin-6-yl-methyl-4-(beta-D-ribofuranosyl)aminobenzene 5'-phosphate synthase
MKAKWIVLGGLGGLAAATTGGLVARFNLGRCCEDGVWASVYYPKFQDVGTVKRLTILPLVEWNISADASAGSEQAHPNGADENRVLVGQAGVSYLVQADDTSLLFDVGYNERREHPSPLLRNMQTLGVPPEELDYVFISHLHFDHVGGMSNQRRHTFSFSEQPLNLAGVTALAPVPMTHPTAKVELEEEPRAIAPGIVNLGPIPRQLFFLGWTPEQSLAINVQGKGIVLIIGCGHPTIQRIVDRAEMLLDAPLYGVVGGLHYPVTASRTVRFGLPVQRILGTGKRPWHPISCEDVTDGIAYLQQRHPKLVALSPHDSCDWSLEAFRQAFGEAYQELRVGKAIQVQSEKGSHNGFVNGGGS